MSLYLPVDKNTYSKGEIDLMNIQVINRTKTAKLPFEENASGKTTDVKILDLIKDPAYYNYVFEDYLIQIEKAKGEKNISSSLLYKDASKFENNPDRNYVLEKLGFKYAGFNGNVVNFKDIDEYYNGSSKKNLSIFSSEVLDAYNIIDKATIFNNELILINEIKESKNVVWYDFEGFSLPVSPMNSVKPFQQLVFQVSVIQTIDNREVFKENTIIDPKKITSNDLYSIIEKVYHDRADKYVVYNKHYEIPRMKDIIKIFNYHNFQDVEKAQFMLDHIENNTVDLMELFRMYSGRKLPSILLNDQKCKASIKNIEKHISKNNIDLPRPIKEYKNLGIQNGLMAMEAAINRALGLTGDNEWESKIELLKEYCENDVRAMIMVYDFVERVSNGMD